MGYRKGSYCKVWSIESINEKVAKLRITIYRKNITDGKYCLDFAGFISCLGEKAVKKCSMLSKGDRIKLGEIDVVTKFDREKKINYVDYKLFSFDIMPRLECE